MDSKEKKCSTMPPFRVASVALYNRLNELFKVTDGWIGADGAYSVAIENDKVLWTFGDTWIGTIRDGKRVAPKMVNNTVALQVKGADRTSMKFYWPGGKSSPQSIWTPGVGKQYYWPADCTYLEGKLFVFLHKIRTNKKLPPPFQFETVGDDLSIVSNADEEPLKWKKKKIVLTNDTKTLHYATACMQDGDYVYIYSNYEPAKRDLAPHPLIVSRIKKSDLLSEKLGRIQYFNEAGKWSSKLEKPKVLFFNAAPEMSVSRVEGISGYLALYMPPLSKKIAVRHAKHPEGPWSEEIVVYDCPEKEDYILLYSAKMHQELVEEGMKPGTLIVTYCRNTKEMKDHIEKPEIYFPRAIKVELESVPNAE